MKATSTLFLKSKAYCTSPVEGNTAKTTATEVQLTLKHTNHIHYLSCFRKAESDAFREDMYLLNEDRNSNK